MKLISIISDDISQVFRIVVPSTGEKINCLLNYSRLQEGWFLSFDYKNFSLNGVRIVNSDNFLRQFKNILNIIKTKINIQISNLLKFMT